MKRREMLKVAGGAAVAAMGSGGSTLLGGDDKPRAAEGRRTAAKSKRQLVLDFLDEGKTPRYVPAAFFIHFGKGERVGQSAIDKHKEYFRFTGMDFVKVQYEAGFPRHPEIEKFKGH